MLGVKYILQQYAYLDAARVAGLGASYGGYMINWINGHNPEGAFRCLVNHDGVFSQSSMYFTTEELFFSGKARIARDTLVVSGMVDVLIDCILVLFV